MLLKGFDKKDKKDSKPEWVPIAHTMKKVTKSDIFVLGHADVKLPPIISSSNLKGVKARLVSAKPIVSKTPPKPEDVPVNMIMEWEFTEDGQSKPIYFDGQKEFTSDFWIEMLNPNPTDAVVNASIHCLVRSKSL